MEKQEFNRRVYQIVSEIPRGRVATYGMIAFLTGMPQRSRQVGQALHNAPDGPKLPCHRVVNCKGRLAPGWPEQRSLLLEEGVRFRENGTVDLKQSLWNTDGNRTDAV